MESFQVREKKEERMLMVWKPKEKQWVFKDPDQSTPFFEALLGTFPPPTKEDVEESKEIVQELKREEEEERERENLGQTKGSEGEEGDGSGSGGGTDPVRENKERLNERYKRIFGMLKASKASGVLEKASFSMPKWNTPPLWFQCSANLVRNGSGGNGSSSTEANENKGRGKGITSYPEVPNKIMQAARYMVWERMAADVLNQEELMEFYAQLEKAADKHAIMFQGLDCTELLRERGKLQYDKYIGFEGYMDVAAKADVRINQWLTPILFVKLRWGTDDNYFRRVPIIWIFNYVMKKVWLKQTRLGFMNYDIEGRGYIIEDCLESYLKELIPTLHQLDGLDPSLEPFYVCAAARRFFFFLDTLRLGKVQIVNILASMLVDDILELRESEVKESNWFSKQKFMSVYRHYLMLDKDGNGMLSKEEFRRYNYPHQSLSNRLAPAIVNQLYSDKSMFEGGQMDFRGFVDFVLAMEYMKESQSIAYFFKLLDLEKKGYLNAFDMQFFYRDITDILKKSHGDGAFEVPRFEDVKDEIFDMVKPSDPLKITLKDLVTSGRGDVVIAMLIDAKGFVNYEAREYSMPQLQTSQPSPIEHRRLSNAPTLQAVQNDEPECYSPEPQGDDVDVPLQSSLEDSSPQTEDRTSQCSPSQEYASPTNVN